MSNWISQAKQQAEELRKKEQEDKQKRINLAQQESSRLIRLFYQAIEQTRIEIENLFSLARSEELRISVAGEVPFAKINTCGNFLVKMKDLNDGAYSLDARFQDPGPKYVIESVYAIGWTIIEPKSGKKIDVFLGADCKKINGQDTMDPVISIRDRNKPSIKTVAELETEIKKWLVEIYSK